MSRRLAVTARAPFHALLPFPTSTRFGLVSFTEARPLHLPFTPSSGPINHVKIFGTSRFPICRMQTVLPADSDCRWTRLVSFIHCRGRMRSPLFKISAFPKPSVTICPPHTTAWVLAPRRDEIMSRESLCSGRTYVTIAPWLRSGASVRASRRDRSDCQNGFARSSRFHS